MATTKPVSRRTLRIQKWTPGLNTRDPSAQLGLGSASVASNVDFYNGEVLTPRKGWQPMVASTAWPTGTAPNGNLVPYTVSTTSVGPTIIAYGSNNNFYSANGLSTGATGWTNIATNPYGIGAVSPKLVMGATIAGSIYMSMWSGASNTKMLPQGFLSLAKWNGTSFSVSSSPKCMMVAAYQNALWVAGDNSNPSRLSWSGQTSGSGVDTWPANNFIDVNANDGDFITGLAVLHNALLVFKQHSVWRITGTPPDDASLSTGTLAVTPLNGVPGCSAADSVSVRNGVCIYLNDYGLYSFDGVHSRCLTDPVKTFFAAGHSHSWFLQPGGVQGMNSGCWINDNQYLLSGLNGTSSLVVTLTPFALSQWGWFAVFGSTSLTSVAVFKPSFGAPAGTTPGDDIVVGTFGAGYLLPVYLGGVTDNGTGISWKYRTGMLPLGAEDTMQFPRFSYIRAAANTDSFTATLRPQFSPTAGASVSVSTSSAGDPQTDEVAVLRRVTLAQVGRSLELELSGTVTSVPPVIHEFTIDYSSRLVP